MCQYVDATFAREVSEMRTLQMTCWRRAVQKVQEKEVHVFSVSMFSKLA